MLAIRLPQPIEDRLTALAQESGRTKTTLAREAIIELTQGGKAPITLSNGEQRAFLHDGDAVILRGWCEKPGCARIGFGENRGEVLPAVIGH